MANQRTSGARETPASAQAQAGETQMKSPFIPLLWLLIPFIAVIVYGILTSPH